MKHTRDVFVIVTRQFQTLNIHRQLRTLKRHTFSANCTWYNRLDTHMPRVRSLLFVCDLSVLRRKVQVEMSIYQRVARCVLSSLTAINFYYTRYFQEKYLHRHRKFKNKQCNSTMEYFPPTKNKHLQNFVNTCLRSNLIPISWSACRYISS